MTHGFAEGGDRTKLKIILALSVLLILPSHILIALAAPDETYGVVTNVLDGDTFDLAIEKFDPRIMYAVERIKLADVSSPNLSTSEGLQARDFTSAVLLNKPVYLDIDDLSGYGRDPYSRLICVVYLTGIYGQPIITPCFNRMLVDSGYAVVEKSTNDEFNPVGWWRNVKPATGTGSSTFIEDLERSLGDQLRKPPGQLEKELDRRAKEAADWIRGQLDNRGSGA